MPTEGPHALEVTRPTRLSPGVSASSYSPASAPHPFAELSEGTMETLFPEGFPGWDYEHASIMETSLMLHLRPELVLFDRAVDDASKRHPWYDVVPAPEDFVPASGTLWKATQASEEKGRITWEEIVAQFRAAIASEFSGADKPSGTQRG